MTNKINRLIITATILSLAACGSPKGGFSLQGNPATVIATVNGQNITEKDVLDEVRPDLKRVETEIYKMEKSGVEQLIDKKLIEQAAAKEGKSSDKYLEDYFKGNIKDPTEDEIKKFYEFRKKQMGDKKFEDVKATIAEFLKSNQENALRRKLINGLRADAKIVISLEAPRVDIEIGKSPTMGTKGAPVTIVEFSDYQCPFCGRARPTINKVLETYPKEVLYVFKDFPLSFHKDAQKAHEAAHCAADQDKYWEMNKELFANQKAISVDDLKKSAKKIGLNMDKFDKCLDEGAYAGMVMESVQEGSAAGVTGTPAFFVNGIMISGARPFADFKEAIDSELKK